MTKKIKCQEGDCFGVPLREGGFASGVVARVGRSGVLLCYFFGPSSDVVPEPDTLVNLKPGDAILVGKVGDLGLSQGKWPIVGPLPGWDRGEWPMPVFVRYEELTGRSFRVTYDDDDPNKVVREEQVEPGAAEQAPKDGLMGAGFAEKVLTSLMR